jgi:hypothetical protein
MRGGERMISLRRPGEGGKTDRSGKHVPFGLRPMAAIARQLRDSAGCVCLCSVLSICRRIERSWSAGRCGEEGGGGGCRANGNKDGASAW